MNTITFEKLGLTFHINRSFSLFGTGITIHWYAVIILLGVILGFSYALWFAKKEKLDSEYLYDVLLWGLPSAIVMARVYYVVFNFSQYRENLWDVFKIWNGGIAIYGAVIGAVISTYIYTRVKKQNTLQIFDMGAFGLVVGQAIGRWGNFVNQEAFGTNTDSIFSMSGNLIRSQLMKMEQEGMAVTSAMGVHPTFLYESVWNLFGAVVLGFFHRYKKHHGEVFWLYLSWYGLGRFFIEGLRIDSLMFYNVRISQCVALLTLILGVVMFVISRRKPVIIIEESKETLTENSPREEETPEVSKETIKPKKLKGAKTTDADNRK